MTTKTVKTPHGEFEITRRDTVAISAMIANWDVTHHYRDVKKGETLHIEHRKIPGKEYYAGGWCKYIATYDMNGNLMELE
jgi:hypothetical protein